MGTGIVDDQHIAHIDLGQHTVNGKLIIVLAQTADHIVFMVAGGVLFAQHGDVVVGTVHGRAHQVGSAGIQADILFINVLFVDGCGNQAAIRSQHKAPHLGKDGNVAHTGGHQDLLKLFADTLANGQDIIGALLRLVGNANAAGQVDELDVCTGLLVQTHSQVEQDTGQFRVIIIGNGIAGQESMDAEVLCTQCHQAGISFGHLLFGHAVLGIAGVIHDAVAQVKGSAGVKAAADRFGDTCHILEEIHMGQVVQVNVSAQVIRLLHVLHRRFVGGEHDIAAAEATGFAQQQFGVAGAVHAAAFLFQDAQQVRVGGCLNGKILLKTFVPCKSFVDKACIGADAFFVIKMERGRHIGNNFLCLLKGDERFLFRHNNTSFPLVARRGTSPALFCTYRAYAARWGVP